MKSTEELRSIREKMLIGNLQNNDANFRTVALWLAKDPLYCQVPLSRLRNLHQWLSTDRLLVATIEGKLVGALAWTTLDSEKAQHAIFVRKIPAVEDLSPDGDAILIAMIAGSRTGVVKTLMRQFIASQRGKIMLYVRHQSRGAQTEKFGWIDRSGVLEGDDLSETDKLEIN